MSEREDAGIGRKCFSFSVVLQGIGVVSLLATLAIVATIGYMFSHSVVPVVDHVQVIARRADVMFRLMYDYVCNKTHLLTVDDCALLKT
jgi:hypothetical protein